MSRMMFASIGKLLVLVMMLRSTDAAVDADRIENLPGLTYTPNFKQYSGYLKASDKHYLHYWFVESQSDPASDPLVLWLNGGPGCSSLDGLLTEHGPFMAMADGKTLKENPYSWNKIANMLYLEAPAGVGFSYSTDDDVTTDDNKVARENYNALQTFLALYPEFSSNEFYITGESYGGIYVPTLSALVVDDNKFNFKGFAVGNGLSDSNMNDQSLVYFGYYHGLFGTEAWEKIVRLCCKDGCSTSDNCNFTLPKTLACEFAVQDALTFLDELNVYNLYEECYRGPDYNTLYVVHPHQLYLFQNNPRTRARLEAKLSEPSVRVVPPCVNVRGSTMYLNQADVRTALHIPATLPTWAICSNLPYTRIYDTVRQQYQKILATQKQRILVYNGDVDMACNYLGDQWFTDSLQLPVVHNRTRWHYTAVDNSSQVAGYAKTFQQLTFVTVKGSGHMVPQDKPIPALEMFTNFIKNRPFS